MGRPPRENWKKRAAEAAKSLKEAPHGARGAKLSASLADEKQNPNTIRRQVRAWNYLEGVREADPALYEILSALSFSFVELIASWAGFDSEGAATAAKEAALGQHSITTLRTALEDARKQSKSRTPASLRIEIKDAIAKTIQDYLPGAEPVVGDGSKDSWDAFCDFRFDRAVDLPPRVEEIAVLVVGPYQDPTAYSMRMREWIIKGFGLTVFYHEVFLVLTSYQEWDRYGRSIKRLFASVPTGRRLGGKLTAIFVTPPAPPKESAGEGLKDEEADGVLPAPLPDRRRDPS